MKILQVNNVYGEKSTGKLTQAIHLGLQARGHESLAVFGRGKDRKKPGVIRLCPNWYGKLNSLLSRITGLPYGGCHLSTLRLKNIIRRQKPDVVHLQCINGNFVNIYSLIRWLKKKKIPTVCSLHAEFMYTANCGHAFDCDRWMEGCGHCPDRKKAVKSLLLDRTAASWKKMRRAFEGFADCCVMAPVSPWTEQRAKQSPIVKDFPFRTVLNGLDTAVFDYAGDRKQEKDRVLHVTAQFSLTAGHNKGGIYLVELAKRLPQVTFVVAGPCDAGVEVPDNVELLGTVADQKQLAEQYRRAGLTLVLSRKETFSMPCAESLCCGTPVAGFRAGAPEQIALPDYSEFVAYGDMEALEAAVVRGLSRDCDPSAVSQQAKEAYSQQTMLGCFVEVYKQCQFNSKK